LHSDELASLALVATVDLKPSCFEYACTNDVWMKEMEEEMHSIEKNKLQKVLEEIKERKIGANTLFSDNQSTI